MNRLMKALDSYVANGKLPNGLAQNLYRFYESYIAAIAKNGYTNETAFPLIDRLAKEVIKQILHPYRFEPYHQRILKPFNYYEFGLNLIRPLIDLKHSEVRGLERVDQIAQSVKNGENVILFANHQTEPDPQVISILLEKTHPSLAEEMLFVAGHRVITDPLAVPLSKGRNLLCIYSKKHLEHQPELKAERLLHNQRTLKKMGELLNQGGNCIYVAPSGGRDRINSKGEIEVAKFDAHSIELFLLLAQKAQKLTHFYPLALSTFHLLPPPSNVEKEIGENRYANSTPVFLSFGQEILPNSFSHDSSLSKLDRRHNRAEFIWKLVERDYLQLPKTL
ncbi:Glycerol-3-phosphate acyltransferase,chloroplastic [Chlamydiales bacterium STE3]|nr:Glycerol-3-phosphate acyltransferase,chloroplastic [Chlamydiales bacterium STE3]